MEKEIRILVLDENESDAELIDRELQKAKIAFLSRRAATRTDFLREINIFRPDIILTNFSMAGFSARDALDLLKQFAPSIPLIVVSDSLNDQTAADIIHAGAVNYVTKRHLFRVVPAIIDALTKKRLKEERGRAADRLQQSEHQYRMLFEASPQSMWVYDSETLRFLDVNDAAISQYGYSRDEFLSMTISEVRPAEDVGLLMDHLSSRSADRQDIVTWRHQKKDGTIFDVEVRSNQLIFRSRRARLVLIQDITQRTRAEIALQESERRYRETLENVKMIAVTLDRTGRITFCNTFLLHLTGWMQNEVLNKDWFDLFVTSDQKDERRSTFLNNVQHKTIRAYLENNIQTKSGARKTILWNNTVLRDPQGSVVGVSSIGQDITERKWAEDALKNSEQRYRQLFERNLAGVYRTRPDGRILDCNEAFAGFLGYESAEVIKSRSSTDFYHHPRRRNAFIEKLREQSVLTNVQTLLKRKDGSPLWVLENVSLVLDEKGDEVIEGTMMDITEWKLAEERLEYLSNYDQVTDLPTRLLYTDRLKQAMIDAGSHGKLVAVLFVDLDRFRAINDSLGHSAGDILLRQVAKRLAIAVQPGDTVGRSGGDEFTIILRDIENVQQAADRAKQILSNFEKPFRAANQDFYLGASIGVTLFPLDDQSIDSLFKNAETAMYKAKELGRNNYQFFTAEMQATLLKQFSIETNLRHALERSEFRIDYQPKVNIQTGRIIGAEALIKWHHPQLGILSPSQFIPLAEETGAIGALGEWVLKTAAAQCKIWHESGLPEMTIAINLSAHQFRQERLTERFSNLLHEIGLSPRHLEIEITETVLMQSTPENLRKLRELKALGIRISIDDFGTGFSSLSYLKQLPIDTLKIDQSFVRDIPSDPNDTAITRAIIVLAHSLQLNVIAEGVETAEQLAFLSQEGCDEMQGFYFSHPLPANDFESLLRSKYKVEI